jgi:predicted helicase
MKSIKTVQSYNNTAKETNRSSRKNTKSGFADPDRIKDQNPKDFPVDSIKSPWDFSCPQYDQRSSNFVNAGSHYGIGLRQPVGHEGNPKREVDTLPNRRVNTTQDDDLG